MKVISLDISGKVFKYDNALYDAIIKECGDGDELVCLTPYRAVSTLSNLCYNLYCFVPQRKASSYSLKKRICKAVEGLLNYICLGRMISSFRPDILHMQWLPFLEFCGIEGLFLKWYKWINPNLKIILTIHNIYPHNSSERQKQSYRKRFIKIAPFINMFIVHTKISACELITEFGISMENISVIKHGAFVSEFIPTKSRKPDAKCRLLMFGYQSYYKGTDLLLDAVERLPQNLQKQIVVKIVGKISGDILAKINKYHKNIVWENTFLPDDELSQEIVNADVLVYPYRKISQSGALLLGLSFKKPIIVSNLPSFVETLDNYPLEMFFRAGDVNSLKETIENYLSFDDAFRQHLVDILSKIKDNNSWEMSAKETYLMYQKMCNVLIE